MRSIRKRHGAIQNASLTQSKKEERQTVFGCASRKKDFALSHSPISKNIFFN